MRSSRDYEIPTSSGINEKQEVENGRLEKRVIDFEKDLGSMYYNVRKKVEQEVGSLQGYDYMFSCFGTTRANAGSAVGVVGVPERTGGVHAH